MHRFVLGVFFLAAVCIAWLALRPCVEEPAEIDRHAQADSSLRGTGSEKNPAPREMTGKNTMPAAIAANPGKKIPLPAEPSGLFPVVLRPPRPRSAAETAFFNSLKPRQTPGKEPLAMPPGEKLRLTIKLADALEARAQTDGGLSLSAVAPDQVSGLARLARLSGMRFRRAHTATDEALRSLERRAAERSGRAQPDLGGWVEVLMPSQSKADIVLAAQALHALPEVEHAELESLDSPPPPPAADIAPTTPLLSSNQAYRAEAAGINADYVWSTFGIRGHSSLRVTDCEYQFNPSHEDLSGLAQIQPGTISMYTAFGDDHGTAVMGVLFAGDNNYGMTGTVPQCEAWFYPEFSTTASGTQSRTACVTSAIANSQAGDIVVLEMQASGATSGVYVPAEYTLSVFNAVKTGTDAGVITIAAAGNGGENLDGTSYSAYLSRGDSGAVIVGAGTTSRARQTYSTYGSRVNAQGWGASVATTGYGSLATYGSDANQEYASSFSGTSSATPVVASAAALLQSVAIEICELRLEPAEMRSLLVSTGRAQTGDTSKPIGPLPFLQPAAEALLAAHPPAFSTLRSWALFHFGTDSPAWEGDPDRDGVSSLMEYVIGTDPGSGNSGEAGSLPKIEIDLSSGTAVIVLTFRNPPSRAGALWQIQRSSDLAAGSWQDVPLGQNGVTWSRSGDLCIVRVPSDSAETARFFRLQASALE